MISSPNRSFIKLTGRLSDDQSANLTATMGENYTRRFDIKLAKKDAVLKLKFKQKMDEINGRIKDMEKREQNKEKQVTNRSLSPRK